MALPETFVRVPQDGARVTRWACAQRHQRAIRPGSIGVERLHGAEGCRSCSVGAAHLRGETPDVTMASVVARVGEKRIEMKEVEMSNGRSQLKRYPWMGELRTTEELSELADVRALGLTQAVIVGRLRKQWSLGEALTTPPGKGQRRTSQREPATEAPAKPSGKRARAVVSRRIEENAERKQIAKLSKLPRAKRASAIIEEVREIVTSLSPVQLLHAGGFEAQEIGMVPAGRLIVVKTGAAA